MWGGCTESSSFRVIEKAKASLCSPRTNPTFLSDNFLASWIPLFLIRHPALSFESWYRAESRACYVDIKNRSWAFYTSYQYSRQLYDWYMSKRGSLQLAGLPIIVDADDIMEQGPTINKLCELLNMNSQMVLYQWEITQPPSDTTYRKASFMSGLWNSTCIDSSRSARGIDLAAKHKEWQDSFGLITADKLRSLVEEAMPDYEYLKSRKV